MRFGFLPGFRLPGTDPSIVSFRSGQEVNYLPYVDHMCKCNVKFSFVLQEVHENFARLSTQGSIALQDY